MILLGLCLHDTVLDLTINGPINIDVTWQGICHSCDMSGSSRIENLKLKLSSKDLFWLEVSTPLKNISQLG